MFDVPQASVEGWIAGHGVSGGDAWVRWGGRVCRMSADVWLSTGVVVLAEVLAEGILQ
jgi:hypothetical protein